MNPYVTHPLIAAGLAALFAIVLFAVLKLFGVVSIPLGAFVAVLAAVMVSSVYYGREAGQREHDLKHMTPPVEAVLAAAGGLFMFMWAKDNVLQWLAAASGSAVACLLLYFLLF